MKSRRSKLAIVLATASSALAAATLQAGTYTWMASPADASWNTSSLNWNSGEAWVDGNDAVFPATSSQKKISLAVLRTANDVTVNGSGYSFDGKLLKVTGKFTANLGTTIAAGFGGESVRLGGPSSATIYMGWGGTPTVKTVSLEDTIVIAPNDRRCFGPDPASPITNIVAASSGPALFANGNISLSGNRIVRIVSGKALNLGAATGKTLTIGSLCADISPGLDFSTNTAVAVPSYWAGAVVLSPAAGATNCAGRIVVNSNLKVQGGATRLGSEKQLATGNDALLYVEGNGSAFSDTRGNLTVDGGILYASQTSRYVEVSKYGQVTVTNGGKIDMPGVEWLNGLNQPGRLVVADGEFTVSQLRLSQCGSSVTAEIHLDEGGLIRASKLRMDGAHKAVFAFNGGAFQSTCSGDGRDLFTAVESRWTYVTFTVGEKGAVFDASNGVNIWWDRPLTGGAAQDGGMRKLGGGILVLRAASTYNGPTVLESGHIQARVDHAIPDGTTLRLGGGADTKFTASTYDTESPARNTVQSIGRVEGSGALDNMTASSVTGSIAPSVDGTIDFKTACPLSGDYEIAADANGCGCVKVAAGQDISGLTLKLTDVSALDRANAAGTYRILDAPNGFTGKFSKSADWPSTWDVRYAADGKTAYLRYLRGTKIVFR